MFLNAPPKPTKVKHVAYIIAMVVLGILLSIFLHIIIEARYLAWAERTGYAVRWFQGCALHPVIQIALPILGAIGGFFLGRFWWKLVYLDRKWAKGRADGKGK